MVVHTAHWRLEQARLACGHTLSLKHGETSGWCPWCAATQSTAGSTVLAGLRAA